MQANCENYLNRSCGSVSSALSTFGQLLREIAELS